MSGSLWGGVSAAVVLLAAGAAQAEEICTSVVPCRLADTRVAGGSLAVGPPARDFKVTGSGLQGQGGNPLGCSVPTGVATAAVINLVAVNPAGTRNLRAWARRPAHVPAPPPGSSRAIWTGSR